MSEELIFVFFTQPHIRLVWRNIDLFRGRVRSEFNHPWAKMRALTQSVIAVTLQVQCRQHNRSHQESILVL